MAIQSFGAAMQDDCAPFSVRVGGREHGGYFANIRIGRDSVPDGWYSYDIRHDDSGNPCEIKNGYIIVNHFGTFCTQSRLPLEEGESLYEGDFDYAFR